MGFHFLLQGNFPSQGLNLGLRHYRQILDHLTVFPVAQTVKRLPTMREIQVRSLGQEDPLEKEMGTHSSTLAWSLVGYSPWGRKESDVTERLHFTLPSEPPGKPDHYKNKLKEIGHQKHKGTDFYKK